MEKMNEKRRVNTSNSDYKFLVFNIGKYIDYDEDCGITLKEFIKSIKYLKKRGKIDVPKVVLSALIYLSEKGTYDDSIMIMFNKWSGNLGMCTREVLYVTRTPVEFLSIDKLKPLITKNIPSYELGINVDQPVFPIDLQDGDNVIVERNKTYVYRKEQGKFYDSERSILISDLDMSTVINVYRTKKLKKGVKHETNVVWSRK